LFLQPLTCEDDPNLRGSCFCREREREGEREGKSEYGGEKERGGESTHADNMELTKGAKSQMTQADTKELTFETLH
jgi:hypothetical protein